MLVESLYDTASTLADNERDSYLERHCPDAELRELLESLLERGESAAGSPLEAIVGAFAAQLAEGDDPDEWRIGSQIGPWRIESILGRGGMGAVYLGVRADGAFQHKVAIKLIRGGAGSTATLRRFRQERQILASLQHTNIARLLDGGALDDGTPYLVMEYVEGTPLTAWCREHETTITERLRLFQQVCAAVDYAHRNLIVHRDLKPGNILVTSDGTPKLLDFGIAKLLDTDSGQTITMAGALTPQYASPEQVRGETITTASDVYSLGVVLYELLTGRLPYTIANLSGIEIDKAVCQTQPAAPGLHNELDHILLMALRKEPERRYHSVQQFADDIACYLSDLPVRARPDTTWYRTRKYVRRHWAGLLAASIAVTAICVGAGVAVYQARIAKRQFEQIRQLAGRFLFEFHDAIAGTPGTVKARQMIVSTSLDYLTQLGANASRDPSLQWELAVAYSKVAAAQHSVGPSLGLPRDAAASLEKAIALARLLDARNRLNQQQKETFVTFLCSAEAEYRYLRDYPAALRLGKEAIAESEGMPAPVRLTALHEMSLVVQLMGDLTGSLNALEREVSGLRENLARNPTPESRLRLATALSELGLAQQRLTRLKDAASAEKEALAIVQPMATGNNPQIVLLLHRILVRLGDIAGAWDRPSEGRPLEAVDRYDEAIAVMESLIAADPNDLTSRVETGLVHVKAADCLWDLQPRRALQHTSQALRFLDGSQSKEYPSMPHIAAGSAYTKLRQFDAAERDLRQATRLLTAPATNTEADLDIAWARLEAARGNRPAAAAWLDRLLAVEERMYAKTSTPSYALDLTEALSYAAATIPESARARRQRMVEVWTDQDRRFPGHPWIEQRLAEARARSSMR